MCSQVSRNFDCSVRRTQSLWPQISVSRVALLQELAPRDRKWPLAANIGAKRADQMADRTYACADASRTLPIAKFHGVGPKTAAKMHALGIETGADLRGQTLAFLQERFGKAGNWYFEIARGQDDRPVQPDRERKSSGSETTFPDDLIDPVRIEAGVIAMADDVWAWCEKTNCRGRTITVKNKWASFQISSRSRSIETPKGQAA
jgi:nucleotidyltransferase/DNA polymerase involved in DNA repair